MAVASFNKFNSFVEALAHKLHDLESDQIKVALHTLAVHRAGEQLVDIRRGIDVLHDLRWDPSAKREVSWWNR